MKKEAVFHAGNRVVALERISESKEDIQNQEYALFKTLAEKKWTLVRPPFQVTEHGEVGQKWKDGELIEERQEVQEIISMAKRKLFDILWVFHDDRLTRRGGTTLTDYIRQFSSLGIMIYDYEDRKFKEVDKDSREELMLQLDGFKARGYQEEVRRKTQNAIDSIKGELAAKGKHISKRSGRVIERLGAPRKEIDMKRVIELWRNGYSARGIAIELGVSTHTIISRIKEHEREDNGRHGT